MTFKKDSIDVHPLSTYESGCSLKPVLGDKETTTTYFYTVEYDSTRSYSDLVFDPLRLFVLKRVLNRSKDPGMSGWVSNFF